MKKVLEGYEHWLTVIRRCFPDGSEGKESTCNAGDPGSFPGLGRFPWRRKCQLTPVFLPGEFHGQRSLAGCSSWGRKESDTTEQFHSHLHPKGAQKAPAPSPVGCWIPNFCKLFPLLSPSAYRSRFQVVYLGLKFCDLIHFVETYIVLQWEMLSSFKAMLKCPGNSINVIYVPAQALRFISFLSKRYSMEITLIIPF